MTNKIGSTIDAPTAKKGGRKGCGNRANWSFANTAAMILGFVFFWPIGLFLLCWNISGNDIRDLPSTLKNSWQRVRGDFDGINPFESEKGDLTDNVVFNEYQQTQLDRIREIRTEIRGRKARFYAFREDAKRRADEEEFSRFMAAAPITRDS